MCEVKAAPADEARAVHHSRRREALPPAGFAGDRGFHAKAWSLRFAGFRRIVRGVDRDRRGVVEREFAVSVDGGAGQGGRLIAVCFSLDGTLVDVAEA